ncbi:MAG: diacylglycerol kinase family protein [Planctomycetaceae bacterium]|nr:diacylglycerol kinase family protein [Planctomycetaceae bacterium]
MSEQRRFSLADRWSSVACAVRGAGDMLRSHHNARIHAVATVAAVLAGTACGLTATEWCFVMFSVTSVWMAEALNTSIEYLTDIASPTPHPLAGKAKDAAAAAVLIASLGAVVIGLLVFGPYLLDLLQ